MYFIPLLPIAEAVTEHLFVKGTPQCGAESILISLPAMTADFLAERADRNLDFDHVTAIMEFDACILPHALALYPRKAVLQQALWLCSDHEEPKWDTIKKDILSRLKEMEVISEKT